MSAFVLPSAQHVLYQRRALYSDRHRFLAGAPSPSLSPALTWPRFWQQVDRTLRAAGYRRGTRRQYRHVLRALRSFGVHRPCEVSARRLREFIYSLVDEHASEGRLVMHISALRTIFDRVCGLQLTDRIVGPKRARRLPEILNRTEAERLVRAGRTIRDQVLLGLLYGCGLTGSEAVRLRWGDVREGGLRLHVAASTRYMERILLVPEPLRELLAAGAATCAAEDYIFSGRKAGAHISTRAVEQLVRRACAAAQIERPVSVMTLRHAYAVHRLEAGAGVRRVQEELGHASIRTTERYRRCLTPRIENHPFTRVRELMTTRHGVEPVTFDAEVSRAHVIPPGFRPLSELRGIDPELMRLPFAPLAEENPVLTFMRLLKTRIVGALFPGTAPS